MRHRWVPVLAASVVSATILGAQSAPDLVLVNGRIFTGTLADLALLSRDSFTVPAEALPRTTSVLTMVGGKVVHERK